MSRERIVGLISDKTPRLPHGNNDDDGDCDDGDDSDDDDDKRLVKLIRKNGVGDEDGDDVDDKRLVKLIRKKYHPSKYSQHNLYKLQPIILRGTLQLLLVTQCKQLWTFSNETEIPVFHTQ